MENAPSHLICKLIMFNSKLFLDMSIFWYAFRPVATPSLRGTSAYALCRSVLPYEGTEAFWMAYEQMKEIKEAGWQGSGVQIN